MLQNRVECQLRTPCDPRTGREHGHCTIRHTPGMSLEQIAAATGIPVKRLMKISAPQGDTQVKWEEIPDICRATGRFEWLRFVVRRSERCDLLILPARTKGDTSGEVLEHTRACLQRFTAMVDKLTTISADQRIEPEERDEFRDVAGKLQAEIARLEAYVELRVETTTRGVVRVGRSA